MYLHAAGRVGRTHSPGGFVPEPQESKDGGIHRRPLWLSCANHAITPTPSATRRPMKPKILIVDDEPDALELIQYNLKAAGYDVVTAADGEEALKKARANHPSLVILDVMLPEVDGLEVCKTLRREPGTAAIPK